MAALSWLLILLLVFFVLRISSFNLSTVPAEQPIEVLRNRYANGELNTMEFNEMKKQCGKEY